MNEIVTVHEFAQPVINMRFVEETNDDIIDLSILQSLKELNTKNWYISLN